MQPLYLAATLDRRTEALRHDVLRAHLVAQIFALEFATVYGEGARTLTVAPLSHVQHNEPPVLAPSFPGPDNLPPVVRALYVRVLRGLPIFAGHGETYLKGIDDFVHAELASFGSSWMRAAKFDILSFVMHYVALFSHLKNEAWFGCEEHQAKLPDGSFRPMLLPSSLYPDLLTSYRATLPGGGSFRLAKRLRKVGAEEAAMAHATLGLRQHKARAFTQAWRATLKAGCGICRELASAPTTQTLPEQFWDVVRHSPQVTDLPPVWQSFFYSLVTALAHTVDQVLDDADWRHKFAGIWKRLPVSIMLTSLRLVNPIPFVDRVIKLFCWKPPGMHSLLQRIGGMVAASEKTAASLKAHAKTMDSGLRVAIEKAVDSLLPADMTGNDAHLSSADPTASIAAALASTGDALLQHPTAPTIIYAKLWIRRKEKDAFVDALGGKTVTTFLAHFASAIPPLLSEIWQCIDFAALMSSLVDTVSLILAALSQYDEDPTDTTREEQATDVVNAIYAALLPFLKAAYPLLHALATRTGKKSDSPSGLLALVTYLLDTIIKPTDGAHSVLSFAADTKPALDALSESQKQVLWHEVDQLIGAMATGQDPKAHPHPARPVMDSMALEAYWRHLAGQVAGEDNVLPPSSSDNDGILHSVTRMASS
ncbi:hypothetical protein HKX48_009245 [Thoreauomyces humboldtii]|nr:hypothetical protein HKX48_009245 [Thoreauomyces humboldtii]